MEIIVYTHLSPRLVEILPPTTDVTVQEIVNVLRDWEDDNLSYDPLIDAAGKEQLGGGISVGITATLQNTQIMFSGRTTPLETGTCTTSDPTGTILYASGGQFETNGVYEGCTVYNETSGAMAVVTVVDSEIELHSLVLSGGSRATWVSGDTYKIYPNVHCNISGGNLVAIDENGAPLEPVRQSPNVQVIRSSSSSATLQELDDIQYSSFGGGVTLDTVNGDDLNRGNMEYPVKTLARAKEITIERGFLTIFIVGALTIGATDDVSGFTLTGRAPTKDFIYAVDGCLADQTHFNHLTVEGDLTGANMDFYDCLINDTSGLSGLLRNCCLSGTLVLGGAPGDIVAFISCYLGMSLTDLVEIDMSGNGPALAMHPYAGGIRIKNKSGASKVAIDFSSGRLELASTVTAGTFFIRGVGEITVNEATGITLNDGALINPAIAADSVWDELRSEHTIEGSFGATDEWASAVDTEAIADAVWDEELAGHSGEYSAGLSAQKVRFQGAVHIDTQTGTAGTDYDIGTPENPVNNFADARTIADANGLRRYKIHYCLGSIVGNYEHWFFESDNAPVMSFSGNSLAHSSFKGIGFGGTITAPSHIVTTDCAVSSCSGYYGYLFRTLLGGIHKPSGPTNYIYSLSADDFVLDLSESPSSTFCLYQHSGKVTVKNMTSTSGKVYLEMNSGEVTIDSSCTLGTVRIRGIVKVNDQSQGVTVLTTEVTTPDSINTWLSDAHGADSWEGDTADVIADAVWDEPSEEHNEEGTMGGLQNTGGSGSGDPEEIADAVWAHGDAATIKTRIDTQLSVLEAAIRGVDSDTLKTLSDQLDVLIGNINGPRIVPGNGT